MKLWILSDLHQEFETLKWVPKATPEHDVLVLAGDTHGSMKNAFAWAQSVTNKPVVLLAGNHEFYGKYIEDEIASGRELDSTNDQIHFLENRSILLNGVRFIGATLWTDFCLWGIEKKWACQDKSHELMADYNSILTFYGLPNRKRRGGDYFIPSDAERLHKESIAFIERELSKTHNGPTVVVTHHAPHRKSLQPRYEEQKDQLSASFVSDLSGLIDKHQPEFWIHGHVHEQFDYMVGNTRIICNSRGYSTTEQTNFKHNLIIDID